MHIEPEWLDHRRFRPLVTDFTRTTQARRPAPARRRADGRTGPLPVRAAGAQHRRRAGAGRRRAPAGRRAGLPGRAAAHGRTGGRDSATTGSSSTAASGGSPSPACPRGSREWAWRSSGWLSGCGRSRPPSCRWGGRWRHPTRSGDGSGGCHEAAGDRRVRLRRRADRRDGAGGRARGVRRRPAPAGPRRLRERGPRPDLTGGPAGVCPGSPTR
ncbi:hypothetical protein [Nocardioides convexus]|uniref:hypothetical protein n=1 Tax=Nocardioides convexus TaxID=2712224 RepID=UPI002418B26D|nr:hypothetical protein [Nocardioides convexus]